MRENLASEVKLCQVPMSAAALKSITYTLGTQLYVSLTNRCNAVSLIQSRGPGFAVPASSGFSLLPEGFEPSAAEVAEVVASAVGAGDTLSAIVFAGAGEPLLKQRTLLEAAELIRQQDASPPLRINTNGLVPKTEAADLAARMKAAGVASATVALASADPEEYLALMQPEELRFSPAFTQQLGHGEVTSFVKACVGVGMAVECTAVEAPGVDVDAAAALASELGASFRARSYHPAP